YRNHQRHHVNGEYALRVLAPRANLEEIEDRIHVGIEPIVTLTCERKVTPAQVLDRLCCITIQFRFRGHTVLRGIVAVVALIIKWSCYALIVGWNGTRSYQSAMLVLA